MNKLAMAPFLSNGPFPLSRNHIVRLPDEKLAVIVLMNRSDGVPAEIADNIARNYCPDFTGSPRLR